MPPRGRAALASLALAVFFALPLLPEILGARRLIFRDAQITHWPWRRVAVASLEAGRAPFVDEGSSGGQPLLANPNAVLLYPTLLLEKVVGPASAFNAHYLLQVLWAFFGARLLARRLGRSEGAAFLAGVTFAFSGMFLSYASAFANSSAAAAWLPWCAVAALSLARAENAPAALARMPALALALGLQLLAGEPALSLLTLLCVAALGLAAGSESGSRTAAGSVRFLAGMAGAGLAAAAIAAPLLLPLQQVLPLTYRGQHVYSERAFGASPLEPWRLLEWLFPRFAGDPGALGVGAHWQRGDLLYVWCVTFGVVPLVLVAMAACSRSFWTKGPLAIAGGSLLALLFAFGPALPFYRLLGAITVLRRLRYPIKFYLLTTLGVALLTAWAADHLASRRLSRARAAVLVAAGALFLAAYAGSADGGFLEARVRPLLSGLAAPASALLPAILHTFRVDALLGLAAAVAIAGIFLGRARPPAVGYLLGFATLVFALPWGLPLFVSADERDLERPPALLAAMVGPGRLFVSPRLPEFNVLATGTAHPGMAPRVSKLARVQIEELIPGTGQVFGARYLFDGDPDGSYGWYNRLASEACSASPPAERSRLLRAFGGRWILAEEGEDYPGTRSRTGLTVAGRRLVLLEVEHPVPELRWAGREFRRRSLSGAIAVLRSERFDPATDVVLPGGRDGEAGDFRPGQVEIESVEADSAAARVHAQGAGYLLFSRTSFPAWRARVDGRDAPVLVANARDLAVAVPAGEHRVEILWDERPFVRGVALQGAALLFLVLAGASRRRS